MMSLFTWGVFVLRCESICVYLEKKKILNEKRLYIQDGNLKNTMNILSRILVDLSIKPTLVVQRVKYNLFQWRIDK